MHGCSHIRVWILHKQKVASSPHKTRAQSQLVLNLCDDSKYLQLGHLSDCPRWNKQPTLSVQRANPMDFQMNTETSWILSRLLASNDSPDEAESQKIQKSLRALQSRISPLRTTLMALEEFARQHQTALAPIRALPTELLIVTFTHCWEQSTKRLCNTISLSSVCRKWRLVSMNTPKLWSDVHLLLPTSPRDGEAESVYCQIAQEVILRSQLHPLRFHIDGTATTKDFMRAVQVLLNAQSHRWKSLVAEGMLEPWHSLSSERDGSESAPLLEDLTLTSRYPQDLTTSPG